MVLPVVGSTGLADSFFLLDIRDMFDDDITVSVADDGAVSQDVVYRTGYSVLVEVTEIAAYRDSVFRTFLLQFP